MLVRSIVVALTAGALLVGCSTETEDETQEIIDNLIQAGFPADSIEVIDGRVLTGGDGVVSLQASREMLQVNPQAGGKEQYRTNNIVGPNIHVICFDGVEFVNDYSPALDAAIASYNYLGLSFTMQRRTGSLDRAGCDATIVGRVTIISTPGDEQPHSGLDGQGDYPANGKPGAKVVISTTLAHQGVGMIRSIIAHEIGHTIGMRHSDYYDSRISCSSSVADTAPDLGYNWIPGSAAYAVPGGSVFNTCHRNIETGELTNTDMFAIISIYGNPEFEIFTCCTDEAPALSSWGPNHLDLFVRGLDHQLWHIAYDNGLGSWEALGGDLISAPAAVSWGPGRIDVFALASDYTMGHIAYENGYWSGWESMGGSLVSGPGVASWGPGRLDVFAVGANYDLQHLWYEPYYSWVGWESLGGYPLAATSPGAVSSGYGRIDVFPVSYNTVQHLWFDNWNWSSWESFPGYISSGVSASSWGAGRIDLFSTDQYNITKRMKFTDNIWWGWADEGYATFSTPAAASWGYGHIDVFTMGLNNAIWHKWYNE